MEKFLIKVGALFKGQIIEMKKKKVEKRKRKMWNGKTQKRELYISRS